MDRSPLDGTARFRKKVIRVVGFIPNAPTPRRDTTLCELDCGHARAVLSVNRGEETAPEQSRQLIGAELECAKCAVLERIRHKARLRAANRGRPARRGTITRSRAAS
jgi:hypothetical protein